MPKRQVQTSLSAPEAPTSGIDRVSKRITQYIDYMKPLFTPDMEITVIARRPGDAAGDFDFPITNDDLDELVKLIERSKERPAV